MWIGLSVLLTGVCLVTRASFISGVLIGAALCILLVNHQFIDLPTLLKPNSSIKGTVISLPRQGKFSNRFQFQVSAIDGVSSRARILVYWPGQVNINEGDHIQFKGRGRPIHSTLNQGSFNYQRWLIANGFSATFKVLEGDISSSVPNWQFRLKRRINARLTTLSQQKYIRALAFGDRSLFDDDSWQLLKMTGTGHLFAISGLHLSLLALFSFSIFHRLYINVSTQRLLSYADIVCSGLSLIVCYAYADLSGLALPTLRALLLLCVLMLFLILKQRITIAAKLMFCLLILLILSPSAMLSASFWLSFGAMSLIYVMIVTNHSQQSESPSLFLRAGRWLIQLVKLQLWLFIGLLGLNVVFFAGFSTVAPITNLIAVPLISLVVLPLILNALLAELAGLGSLVDGLLTSANYLLEWLIVILELFVQFDYAWLLMASPSLSWLLMLFTSLAFLWWQLPSSMFLIRNRILIGALSLIILGGSTRDRLAPARWTSHFLDVGQGNSTVIIKNNHAIIIDTGKSFLNNSVAMRTVLPFIAKKSVVALDFLIVTHDDNDHSGGTADILAQFPQATLISNQQQIAGHHAIECVGLAAIDWQGLVLKFSQMPHHLAKNDNDSSCIIHISDQDHSVLLVGDIGKKAERYLVDTLDKTWQSTVLQIGHHGSKTSSSNDFLDKIRPEVGVISDARFNQWHFPHPQVLRRLSDHGIIHLDTAKLGQISITFTQGGYQVTSYRHNIAPFWYNRDLSFGHYHR